MESINANSQDMDDGLEEMWMESKDGIIAINPCKSISCCFSFFSFAVE